MRYPLQHPEIEPLFQELLGTLLNESDRGALLIGAAHVDNYLRLLVGSVFPASLGRRKRSSLLNYPGPLSSFSAKIELAFAFRLIPGTTYQALHSLRQLRNDVAHSPESFDLSGREDHLSRMYALGPGVPTVVKQIAVDMMLRYKYHVVRDVLDKSAAENPEAEPFLTTEKEFGEFIDNDPRIMNALQRELPKWEMVAGISLLCSAVVMHREDVAEILTSEGTLKQSFTAFAEKSRAGPA